LHGRARQTKDKRRLFKAHAVSLIHTHSGIQQYFGLPFAPRLETL